MKSHSMNVKGVIFHIRKTALWVWGDLIMTEFLFPLTWQVYKASSQGLSSNPVAFWLTHYLTCNPSFPRYPPLRSAQQLPCSESQHFRDQSRGQTVDAGLRRRLAKHPVRSSEVRFLLPPQIFAVKCPEQLHAVFSRLLIN